VISILAVHVSEQLTRMQGLYVKVADTVKGFREIIGSNHDEVPESALYMKGAIEAAQTMNWRRNNEKAGIPAVA
jgi:F0F1-type ATP synthase beta subunit